MILTAILDENSEVVEINHPGTERQDIGSTGTGRAVWFEVMMVLSGPDYI